MMLWKSALNAFDIAVDGPLAVGYKQHLEPSYAE